MAPATTKVSITKATHRRLSRIAGRGKKHKQLSVVEWGVSRMLDELETHTAAPDSKNQERSATAGRDVPAAPTPIGSDQSSITPSKPVSAGEQAPFSDDAGVSSMNGSTDADRGEGN